MKKIILQDIIVYNKEDGESVELDPMPNDLQIIQLNIDRKHLRRGKVPEKAYLDFKVSEKYFAGIFEGKCFFMAFKEL
ncbi:unnamed protein product [Meloidogyne enterolobii]|uniref:Uncharacterized protein n=1 Tax=Meloidogyne enterolobii TaxID=390850 RepID=A0ACB0Z258_MELEN